MKTASHITRSLLLTACAAMVLVARPSPTRADLGLVPLSELISASDYIVLGVVASVTDGGQPGEQLAQITIEQVLRGSLSSPATVRTDTTNPEGASFAAGERLVLFLKSGTAALLEIVQDGLGVVPIPNDQTRTAVLALLALALDSTPDLHLNEVAPFLQTTATLLPPALTGVVLEDLTRTVTPTEGPLVVVIACNAAGAYIVSAQQWAIGAAGIHRLGTARSCLEQLVTNGTDRGLVLAATQALGDLKNQASIPVLLSLLPNLPLLPQVRLNIPLLSPTVSLANDPEDESGGGADLGETARPPGETEPGPPSTPTSDPDGETEPDDLPSDDPVRRRSDGGLTLAAVLALGKIGGLSAVSPLARLAREGDDLALHSTVVHALGLIGGPLVIVPLTEISLIHPNPLIRTQARQTLLRRR